MLVPGFDDLVEYEADCERGRVIDASLEARISA